jgi:hypothetical protein
MASSGESSRRLYDEPVSPAQLVMHVWWRGGPQHEVHAHCRREGLVVTAGKCRAPARGRRGPSPTGLLYHGPAGGWSPTGGRGVPSPRCHNPTCPPIAVPPNGEEVPSAPLVAVPLERRGCLVPVPAMVCFSPFFFSQEGRRFFSSFVLINMVDLLD